STSPSLAPVTVDLTASSWSTPVRASASLGVVVMLPSSMPPHLAFAVAYDAPEAAAPPGAAAFGAPPPVVGTAVPPPLLSFVPSACFPTGALAVGFGSPFCVFGALCVFGGEVAGAEPG